MASGQLHVDIISPERPLYSGPADSVVAPAHDGEIGILPLHAPMVAQLGVGEVRITQPGGGHRDYYAVSGGFLQTSGDKVIIITEEAKSPEDVNEAKVAEELQALSAKLSHKVSADERAELNRRVSWFQSQARVARHKRSGMDVHSGLAKSGLTVTMDKAVMQRRQG
jgi:F-type H+-transporting ATPase subunit epsilon